MITTIAPNGFRRFQIIVIPLIFCFMVSLSMSQSIASKMTKNQSTPMKEDFRLSEGLVIPWRNGNCHLLNVNFKQPDCYVVSGKEWMENSLLSLYNSDGSVWKNFDVQPNSKNHFSKIDDTVFSPFAIYPSAIRSPSAVFLRIVSESDNWFEVVVNEKANDTKFVAKNTAREWSKSSYDFWLYEGIWLSVSPNEKSQQFFEQPNGNRIETIPLPITSIYSFTVKGEWVYFEKGDSFRAWLRWKDGNKLLVGCVFNEFKPPL